MASMAVMDGRGDTKIEWDPDKPKEVQAAEKTFKELTSKGYRAYRQYDDGKRGAALTTFDKYAEKVILVPDIGGG